VLIEIRGGYEQEELFPLPGLELRDGTDKSALFQRGQGFALNKTHYKYMKNPYIKGLHKSANILDELLGLAPKCIYLPQQRTPLNIKGIADKRF